MLLNIPIHIRGGQYCLTILSQYLGVFIVIMIKVIIKKHLQILFCLFYSATASFLFFHGIITEFLIH